VDPNRGFAEPVQIAQQVGEDAAGPVSASARPLPAPAKLRGDLHAARADASWLASSFDLAQGLDVRVMESKLSPEMLDSLFRS
jgi:hypothetical protein